MKKEKTSLNEIETMPLNQEPMETQPLFADDNFDDGFESVSDIIPFWDFKVNPVMIGTFMGEGNVIGDGTYSTKTWLFKTQSGEFLVPQWAMLNELNGVNKNQYIYRLTYRGLYERTDGGKFHQLKVERKKKEVAL